VSLKNNLRAFPIALLAAASALPQSVLACAACAGGKSGDAMARGMNLGILALLIVVGTVLIGFASFAVFLARRAARYPLTSESGASSAAGKEIEPDMEPIAEAPLAESISQPTK